VCDGCWNNPCLFFLPKWLERFGTKKAIAEHFWRQVVGVKPGQSTLLSCIPDFASNGETYE
jgi:hypothetical protein